MSHDGRSSSGAKQAAMTKRKERLEVAASANKFRLSMADTISMGEEKLNQEMDERLLREVEATTSNAFASIGRLGMMSVGNTAAGRWLRAETRTTASLQAKRLREAARLKALQRTPYPMVLARIKLLLEKLQYLKGPALGSSSGAPGPPVRRKTFARGTSLVLRDPSMRQQRSVRGGGESRGPSFSGAERMTSPTLMDPPDEYSTPSPDIHEDPEEDPGVLPIDKVVEELTTSFAYVSDFLKHVPEQARTRSVFWAKMENYKKDQEVYMTGEAPSKFYMILTGQVEVWTHPPGHRRDRTVIDSLKKGQCFGDHSIVNDELRTDCVTSTSNCSMLTVDRDAFLDAFGPYFAVKLDEAETYLTREVDVFNAVPLEDSKAVIRHMLLSSYKAGREWDPHSDKQIYFIKTGTCTLESYDHKFVPHDVSRLMMADSAEDAPAMAETGILANVLIQDGRARGTLGHEEEMRRLKKMLVPKRLLTQLGPGAFFGGGPAAMGDGEFQDSLKVVAVTDAEIYHMHIDTFLRHASSQLLSLFRSDYSFKLTYYFGRNGSIRDNVVVGHPDALLQITARPDDLDDPNPALSAALNSSVHDGMHRGGGRSQQQQKQLEQKRKKADKKGHQQGRYGTEVQKALAHIQELKDGYFVNDPLMAQHMESLMEGSTPVERFWVNPSVSKTGRGNGIIPLLNQVYPEGMAPLDYKIDELVDRAGRHTQAALNRPHTAEAVRPSQQSSPSWRPSTQQLSQASPQQRMDRILALQLQLSPPPPPAPLIRTSRGGVSMQTRSSLKPRSSISGRAATAAVSMAATTTTGATTASTTTGVAASAPRGLCFLTPPVSPINAAPVSTPPVVPQYLVSSSAVANLTFTRGVGAEGSFMGFRSTTPVGEERPSLSQRFPRVGALTAAGVLWERSHGACTPLVRQVLTFEEMAALKAHRVALEEAEALRMMGGRRPSNSGGVNKFASICAQGSQVCL